MTSHPLIDADELAARLADITVLDVRWRLGGPPGEEEFLAGHVPGARYVDLDTDLADPPAFFPGAGRHPLPHPERFEVAMQRAGVSHDRPVVVYDDWSGRAAARAWWLLRHHGHTDVRVLDGGWSTWRDAGHPVETGATAPRSGDFTVSATPSMSVVDADSLAATLAVDAREPARFRGDEEPVDPVAGHVPGAVNVPTSAILDEAGRFRSADELRDLYAQAGAGEAEADVAAYCGSGITACHGVLAMELAGVSAALYPGSWSGWIDDPDRPVERG